MTDRELFALAAIGIGTLLLVTIAAVAATLSGDRDPRFPGSGSGRL